MGENDVVGTTEQFTNRKKNPMAKIELHRCRIQCDFLDDFSGSMAKICDSVHSDEIRNVKQRDIGALELHDMSDPRASCSKGGFKVIMSLMFKASTMKTTDRGKPEDSPIKAVFVVVDRHDNVRHAEEVYGGFNPISSMTVHDNTIAFIVPAQSPQVIRAIGENRDVLRVALFRSHDRKFSMRRVPFVYAPCVGDESCAFCFVRRQTLPDGADFVTGELRKGSRACKNQKRRKTESPAIKRQMAAPPLQPAHSPSSESGISCMSSPTWSIEEGNGGNRRRISGESSSSADEGRSGMLLSAPPYNLYLPPGNCSPASTAGSYGGANQDSPTSEDMGSPSKMPRTEVTYATLTPAAVANNATFEMGSPIPAAVNSPMMETTSQPILSNGCYTYDSLMQDDFPDLFVMHDGGEKRTSPRAEVPDVDKGDKDSAASFELVTPEMLREFRRKQQAELQFDSAMDEADHGVVARPVLTMEEAEVGRESPKEKGKNGDCEKRAGGEGGAAKAQEAAVSSPMEGKSRGGGGAWIIPFSLGIVAALVAQFVVTTLL